MRDTGSVAGPIAPATQGRQRPDARSSRLGLEHSQTLSQTGEQIPMLTIFPAYKPQDHPGLASIYLLDLRGSTTLSELASLESPLLWKGGSLSGRPCLARVTPRDQSPAQIQTTERKQNGPSLSLVTVSCYFLLFSINF